MTKAALKEEIQRLLREKGWVVVAIEGPCGAGKSTLGNELGREFNARVFHADDYFLRPEQRTPERLAEIGGNFDRERFFEEVAEPVRNGKNVVYRKYSCSNGTLSEEQRIPFVPVTIVEGSYCMHTQLGKYFDIGVFLNISPEEQSTRIMQRNGPMLHKRFVDEWIPMENSYFRSMSVPERCMFLI
ncbi:MAG: hypothetical protein IKU32_06695 [Clostridia bacterium]|nr:hypothetical protein [Clostridia bacterium]